MMIKLKDFHETIGAPPFCKHAGSRLLPNAPNIPNCGLVLKIAGYRVSRALEASLKQSYKQTGNYLEFYGTCLYCFQYCLVIQKDGSSKSDAHCSFYVQVDVQCITTSIWSGFHLLC